MRRQIFLTTVASTTAAPAFAADMLVKAPPPVLPAPCVWCGFYAGVNLGRSKMPFTTPSSA
jgi:hypothetical protein